MLDGDALTLNTQHMLAFDSGNEWDITSLVGAGFLAGGLFNLFLQGPVQPVPAGACSTCSCRGLFNLFLQGQGMDGRGDLGRSADVAGLLAAADPRRPAGGGLLVGEPATADQECRPARVAGRTRLGRVVPVEIGR